MITISRQNVTFVCDHIIYAFSYSHQLFTVEICLVYYGKGDDVLLIKMKLSILLPRFLGLTNSLPIDKFAMCWMCYTW